MESLPSLLYHRSTGNYRKVQFRNEIATQKSQLKLLNSNPRIASPHEGAIPALQVDRNEGRFLLSGSFDSTVCVFDLSKWGTDSYLQGGNKSGRGNDNQVYRPVARSVRVPMGNELETPHGHSHSVVAISWYPVDTGAFISASADGAVLVWSTCSMKPVIQWKPLPSVSCMNLSTLQDRSDSLLALGSVDDTCVRLVDIRSGASSHSLVGHGKGITCLDWSPTSDVTVASGSLDGTIRLWDIRKSGSRSCVTVLDRDQPFDASKSRSLHTAYSHLANNRLEKMASPNNYKNSKSNGVISHGGSISALLFTLDGSRLASTGTDGKLQVWDLTGNGHVLPTSFSSRPNNQQAVSRLRTKVPMILQDFGKDTTVWTGHGSEILGYDLNKGGLPQQVLEGHMYTVTSLDRVDHSMQVFSGAMDGMILVWGSPPGASSKRRKERERDWSQDRQKRIRTIKDSDKDSW
jgi:DNA excision repair protein ERCC-8